MGGYAQRYLPESQRFWHWADFVLPFIVLTVVLAIVYREVPDVLIGWRGVWLGAVVAALLFTAGKWAIALYLARSTTSSMYGAAGSLVILLLWIYYTAQIFFFGAEITEVYEKARGTVMPDPKAEWMPVYARVQQGLEPRAEPAMAEQERRGPRAA